MKSHIADILDSGRAPGICTDTPKVDPTSVYAKAPKGLAAIENEPKWKNGPTRSAKDISRYFGMPTSFIRDTWQKPVVALIALLCGASLLTVKAGDLTRGITFANGQQVSASQLHQLVDQATINTSFITGKPINPAPLASDTFLLYSPTLSGFYRSTLDQFLLSNPNLITGQSEKTTPISGDYLLLWDSVGASLVKVSAGHLALNNTNLLTYLFTNAPTVTNPTNGDRVLMWSTGTNSIDPTGTTPFIASVPVQDLYPKTIIFANLPSIVGSGYILNTNLIYQNLTPVMRVVLVETNTLGAPFDLNDEVPADHFIVTNSTRIAYSWGCASNTAWVSCTFAGGGNNLDLNVADKSTQFTSALCSHTNFNLKVYLTYFPISP